MRIRATRLVRGLVSAALYSASGALLVLIVGFVAYMASRPDLDLWHLVDLDREFTAHSEAQTLTDYLALEEQLFAQLDEQVYNKIPPEQRRQLNRYNRGSLSDPARWSPNWNRSFVLAAEAPKAAVLLLHGMSDSPYSLRNLGSTPPAHWYWAYVCPGMAQRRRD